MGAWEVAEVLRPDAPAGEEWLRGTLRSGDRIARFTVIHSVGGRYLHSPEACSLATGWVPERQDLREIGPLAVHSWILRRGTERVALIFWFDLAGTPVRGSLEQHAGAVWQRLKRGEIDSAYGELVFPLSIGADPPPEALTLDLAVILHREASARLWPKPR